MHGRLKVKTTAEQQEAKRKEREKKLKLYNAGTQAAFSKRKKGEYDEEGLKITGEILAVNPDFYSLWNFRKEIYLYILENRNKDEVQKMMEDELSFLETCLKVNPKSYGTWNHRCFVMDNMPKPDWARELHLCNVFLDLDERNFHCWDYRRFVVERSNVNLEDELLFTTHKIQTNFSNYSSWHYRSKLLPLVYPDPSNPAGVQEEVLLKEYEVVQNAIFTDPDDQSAWFYHRWLLGRGKRKLQISCVYVSRQRRTVMVLLSRPILVGKRNHLKTNIDSTYITGKWRTISGKYTHSVLWVMDIPDTIPGWSDMAVSVTLTDDSDCTEFSQGLNLSADQNETWVLSQEKSGTKFTAELSAAATSTLETELESIKELHNLEPENKWVLLTIMSLMKAVDPTQKTFGSDITDCIDKLINVDTKRSGYYRDLKSKYIIESILETHDLSERKMDLSNRSLTTMYHPEWMLLLTSLDLSNNSLSSLSSFHYLQCLKCLNLDNNKISSLDGLELCRCLEDLSIQNNELRKKEDFKVLQQTSIKNLHVSGNPVEKDENLQKYLQTLLKSLQHLDDEILQK